MKISWSEDGPEFDVQDLIDTGMAWRLEGSVGRQAMDAIESGYAVLGRKANKDYWGNRVPSRFEVEPGTMGSIEYAHRLSVQNGYNNGHVPFSPDVPSTGYCPKCAELG